MAHGEQRRVVEHPSTCSHLDCIWSKLVEMYGALVRPHGPRRVGFDSAVRESSSGMVGRQISSRYQISQSTRSECESDLRAHRELLRNVKEEPYALV